MFEEHAGVRVMKVFLNDPMREIHLRAVANLSKVSPGSAKKCLTEIVGGNLPRVSKLTA